MRECSIPERRRLLGIRPICASRIACARVRRNLHRDIRKIFSYQGLPEEIRSRTYGFLTYGGQSCATDLRRELEMSRLLSRARLTVGDNLYETGTERNLYVEMLEIHARSTRFYDFNYCGGIFIFTGLNYTVVLHDYALVR